MKIKIVESNDWMTIYVDGERVYDNHPSHLELDWFLMQKLNLPVEYMYTDKPRVYLKEAPDSRGFKFKAPCSHEKLERVERDMIRCVECEEIATVDFKGD